MRLRTLVQSKNESIIPQNCAVSDTSGEPYARTTDGYCVADNSGEPYARTTDGYCVADNSGEPYARTTDGYCVAQQFR